MELNLSEETFSVILHSLGERQLDLKMKLIKLKNGEELPDPMFKSIFCTTEECYELELADIEKAYVEFLHEYNRIKNNCLHTK